MTAASAARDLGLRTLGLTVAHPQMSLTDTLELAPEAERVGFGRLVVGDARTDSLAVLGAVSALTSAAELVSGVATWTRTPVLTACGAAALYEMSHGRYRLGLGTMPRQRSEEWHQVSHVEVLARMRDFVCAVRSAGAVVPGKPGSHDGRFYRYSNWEPMIELAGPVPIYLAATLPKMATLAGEIADGVIFNGVHSRRWLDEIVLPSLDVGLGRTGRRRSNFDIGQLVFCSVGDTEAEAFDRARPVIAYYLSIPYLQPLLRFHGWDDELRRGLAAAAKGDFDQMLNSVTDEMVDAIAVAGTAAQIPVKLSRYSGLVDWLQLTAPIGHASPIAGESTRRLIDVFR